MEYIHVPCLGGDDEFFPNPRRQQIPAVTPDGRAFPSSFTSMAPFSLLSSKIRSSRAASRVTSTPQPFPNNISFSQVWSWRAKPLCIYRVNVFHDVIVKTRYIVLFRDSGVVQEAIPGWLLLLFSLLCLSLYITGELCATVRAGRGGSGSAV